MALTQLKVEDILFILFGKISIATEEFSYQPFAMSGQRLGLNTGQGSRLHAGDIQTLLRMRKRITLETDSYCRKLTRRTVFLDTSQENTNSILLSSVYRYFCKHRMCCQ